MQLFEYLLRLSCTLMILYLFYLLVLRRLTFYNTNRWYLLCYSMAAFFIPLINISPLLEQAKLTNDELVQWIPVVNATAFGNNYPVHSTYSFQDFGNWILLFFFGGILVMVIRFIIQFISMQSIRRSSQLISEGNVKLYHTEKRILPFSFGNSIFINKHTHSEEELRDIIRHEFIHVKQKHTLDIIWSECLCIINWFNPFAWMIRNAIRQNLEFIADDKVLQNGVDKKQYQYLLLKVVGVQQFGIATNFNFTSLKKRIAMMNKLQSRKVNFLKFLFVLPLMGVILLAFRNQAGNRSKTRNSSAVSSLVKDNLQINKMVIDTVPSIKKENEKRYSPFVPSPNSKGYIITIADNHGECIVIVKNKQNKIVKAVSLVEWDEKEKENKTQYGEIPPPPPTSPTKVNIENIPNPPAPPAPPDAAAAQMPENISSIEVNDKKITLTWKNGKTEIYDLTNPKQKEAFEKKYGSATFTPASPLSNPGQYPNPTIIVDAKENEKNPTGLLGPQKQNISNVDQDSKVLKTLGDFDGLIIVNDKEYDKKSFEKEITLHVNDIKSMDVLKGEKAIQLYGEKGKHGVIKIATKAKVN